MPRPSSALKPSHSPDSVACSGRGGVCLAFGETFLVCVSLFLPMCGVMERVCSVTLGSSSFWGGSCVWHMFVVLELLEAVSRNISVVGFGIRVLWG